MSRIRYLGANDHALGHLMRPDAYDPHSAISGPTVIVSNRTLISRKCYSSRNRHMTCSLELSVEVNRKSCRETIQRFETDSLLARLH